MLALVTNNRSCACTNEIKLKHLTVLHLSRPFNSESDPLYSDASYTWFGEAIPLLSHLMLICENIAAGTGSVQGFGLV